MKQHFTPRDATVAELERKAADAEQKAAKESGTVCDGTPGRSEALSRMGRIAAVWALDLLSGS